MIPNGRAGYGGMELGLPEENAMKCMACKQADTQPGKTTVTLERNGATLVFKDVPAEVCPNCGEDYVDESVTRALLKSAEDMVTSGAQVDIRTYASAA